LLSLYRTYGSGYGGNVLTRGVAGRSFPFFFWPVVWGSGALLSTETYMNSRAEVSATPGIPACN
jgi:hypothetical protein